MPNVMTDHVAVTQGINESHQIRWTIMDHGCVLYVTYSCCLAKMMLL
jgi:hypothetical protein